MNFRNPDIFLLLEFQDIVNCFTKSCFLEGIFRVNNLSGKLLKTNNSLVLVNILDYYPGIF